MSTTQFFVHYVIGDGVAALFAICFLLAHIATRAERFVSRRHRRITFIGWAGFWLFASVPLAIIAFAKWQQLHPISSPGHVSRDPWIYLAPLAAFGILIVSVAIMRKCRQIARYERQEMERWNGRQPSRKEAWQKTEAVNRLSPVIKTST